MDLPTCVPVDKLVREGGLEDESIVNKDLQVHLER